MENEKGIKRTSRALVLLKEIEETKKTRDTTSKKAADPLLHYTLKKSNRQVARCSQKSDRHQGPQGLTEMRSWPERGLLYFTYAANIG